MIINIEMCWRKAGGTENAFQRNNQQLIINNQISLPHGATGSAN
jgi:hypothetical protein